jgi:hypothetical protein
MDRWVGGQPGEQMSFRWVDVKPLINIAFINQKIYTIGPQRKKKRKAS